MTIGFEYSSKSKTKSTPWWCDEVKEAVREKTSIQTVDEQNSKQERGIR